MKVLYIAHNNWISGMNQEWFFPYVNLQRPVISNVVGIEIIQV